MHKILLTFAAGAAFCLTACAQQNKSHETEGGKETLIAYFSATGTTAKAAQAIAEATGGTCYEITPEKSYTSADLNWNDKQSRSSQEMSDPKARPAIKGPKADLSKYEVVFIGYPIWWDEAPRIINSFIESQDLKGKVIIPFATSGGSSIRNSVARLKETYPELDWKEGKLLNGGEPENVREWIEELK